MNNIEKLHMAEYDTAPDIIVEVPQPITLLGAFSDYVNGFSLMCNISSGLVLSASFRDDNSIRLYNAARQDKKKFLLSSIKYRKEDKWANAVKAIALSFQSAGFKLRGMNIVISDSSSAEGETMNAMISAGIAVLINTLYGFAITYDRLIEIAGNAALFSPLCSLRKRDLITIFEGKPDSLIFFRLADDKHIEINEFSSLCSSAFILDSAIPASVMVPLLNEFKCDIVSVFASFKESLHADKNPLELTDKEIRAYSRAFPELDRHYIEYVLEESNIARRSYDVLSAGDVAEFGRLLCQQQRILANKAELTSPETDWLVKRALELQSVSGIAQISLGKPGAMIILIESESESEYTSRLEEYDRIFGFHAVLRRFAPCGSIRIMTNEYSACK